MNIAGLTLGGDGSQYNNKNANPGQAAGAASSQALLNALTAKSATSTTDTQPKPATNQVQPATTGTTPETTGAPPKVNQDTLDDDGYGGDSSLW
jgi:hypothetical protein